MILKLDGYKVKAGFEITINTEYFNVDSMYLKDYKKVHGRTLILEIPLNDATVINENGIINLVGVLDIPAIERYEWQNAYMRTFVTYNASWEYSIAKNDPMFTTEQAEIFRKGYQAGSGKYQDRIAIDESDDNDF